MVKFTKTKKNLCLSLTTNCDTFENIRFLKKNIFYYSFPKCSKMKQKWIEATGRDNNWFPRQHSAICSSHFEDQSFLPSVKSRRLFATAVPTLKLRLVFETVSYL